MSDNDREKEALGLNKTPGWHLANPSKFPPVPYAYDLSNPRDAFLHTLENLIKSQKIHWVSSSLPFRESESMPCYSGEYNGLKFLLFFVVRNYKLEPALEIGSNRIKIVGEPIKKISELVVSSFMGEFSRSLKSSETQAWLDLCGELSR